MRDLSEILVATDGSDAPQPLGLLPDANKLARRAAWQRHKKEAKARFWAKQQQERVALWWAFYDSVHALAETGATLGELADELIVAVNEAEVS